MIERQRHPIPKRASGSTAHAAAETAEQRARGAVACRGGDDPVIAFGLTRKSFRTPRPRTDLPITTHRRAKRRTPPRLARDRDSSRSRFVRDLEYSPSDTLLGMRIPHGYAVHARRICRIRASGAVPGAVLERAQDAWPVTTSHSRHSCAKQRGGPPPWQGRRELLACREACRGPPTQGRTTRSGWTRGVFELRSTFGLRARSRDEIAVGCRARG